MRLVQTATAALTLAWAALVGGCGPWSPPEPITTTAPLPVLTAPAGAAATRDHDGISVTVRPVAYATVPQQQEWTDELGAYDRVTVLDGGVEAHQPTRVFQWSAAVVPVVQPDRLAFVVDVVNRSKRPFRGADIVVRFMVDGRASAAENAMGLAALVVPPGGRDAVTLYGPRLSAVPQGATVGLRLTGPDATDGQVSPMGRAAEWSYAYDAGERSTTTTPVVVVAEKPLDAPPAGQVSGSAWAAADAGPAYPW